MELTVLGLASGYDVEHVIRLFYPMAKLVPGYHRGGDLVLARAGRNHLLAGVRENGICHWRRAARPENEKPAFALASLVYDLLREVTGIRPPWGKMTGVRPVRIIHDQRAAGHSEEDIAKLFLEKYDCTPGRFELARGIADRQRPILERSGLRDCSLYVGIPFCPSRCSYCSFVSRTVERDKKLIQPYVDHLCMELEAIQNQMEQIGLNLRTVYIGGGTPTRLSADQLRQLMGKVAQCFDLSRLEEYTVEAGRPDCTDLEKLQVLKEYGATRISINPQTFEDEVLAHIGRRHTAEDIRRCFYDARQAGHRNINMDLIAGLPGDTEEGFARSLEQAIALEPENITVHTLTLKRASSLVIDHSQEDYADVAAMLEHCDALNKAGYVPYYLYRQKNTLQNLENIGWCKPGYEGYYNIYIMEEVHSILSAGAGGSTKLRQPGCGEHIERIFNYKYANEYINGFDVILERKRGIGEFYGRYLDSQTSG